MNDDMKRCIYKSGDFDWTELIEWELAQASYLSVMKQLKAWCRIKNWKMFKISVKALESEHLKFCQAAQNYLHMKNQFVGFEMPYFQQELDDTIASVCQTYGKRFAPKIDKLGLPWAKHELDLNHYEAFFDNTEKRLPVCFHGNPNKSDKSTMTLASVTVIESHKSGQTTTTSEESETCMQNFKCLQPQIKTSEYLYPNSPKEQHTLNPITEGIKPQFQPF